MTPADRARRIQEAAQAIARITIADDLGERHLNAIDDAMQTIDAQVAILRTEQRRARHGLPAAYPASAPLPGRRCAWYGCGRPVAVGHVECEGHAAAAAVRR